MSFGNAGDTGGGLGAGDGGEPRVSLGLAPVVQQVVLQQVVAQQVVAQRVVEQVVVEQASVTLPPPRSTPSGGKVVFAADIRPLASDDDDMDIFAPDILVKTSQSQAGCSICCPYFSLNVY